MPIKPSIALKNDYLRISLLARESGEPIFFANKGDADGVYMSIEAYEEREKMLAHRVSVLAEEAARLAGVSTFTQEDLDNQMETLLNGYKV